MLSMKCTLRGTAMTARRIAPKAARRPLSVAAFTDWKLEPHAEWCKTSPEQCKELDKYYGLSGVISDKMKAAMDSSAPPEDQSRDDKTQFSVLCEKTGINVSFESVGSSNSQSNLSLKDLGSKAEIIVDGKKLEKDVSAELRPGSHVVFGDMHFQVWNEADDHDDSPEGQLKRAALIRVMAAKNSARLIKEIRRLEAELAHWKLKYGKLHARYKREHMHKRRQRITQVTL